MNKKENLPVLDANNNRLGSSERAIIHHYGLWHPTFVAMVLDKKRKKIICQVKADTKHKDANSLEIDFSAGGHIYDNEEPMDSWRELEEELGLELENYEMHFLGIRQSSSGIIAKNYIENEWQYLWLAVVNGVELNTFPFNEESKALIEFDPKSAAELLTDSVQSLSARMYDHVEGLSEVILTKENFVPAYISGEKIFLKLINAAIKYLEGNSDQLRW